MKTRNKLATGLLAVGLVFSSTGAANAWNPFTEPPRVPICKYFSFFCR